MKASVLTFALLGTAAQVSLAHAHCSDTVHDRARELGTSGPSSKRAHELVLADHRFAFPYPTIVLGVEKAPREELGLASGAPASRLGPIPESGLTRPLVKKRERVLENVLADGKRTFVSHVAYFEPIAPTVAAGTSPPVDVGGEFLFNAYVDCRSTCAVGERYDCALSPYENSWNALERVGEQVRNLLVRERFTHLLVVAKGWNTSQTGTLGFVEAMSQHLWT